MDKKEYFGIPREIQFSLSDRSRKGFRSVPLKVMNPLTADEIIFESAPANIVSHMIILTQRDGRFILPKFLIVSDD